MNPVLIIVIVLAWLLLLRVLKKAELKSWRFFAGSMGMFVILIILLQPVLTMPLARLVSGMAGLAGHIGDTFTAYFKYGILFINTPDGAMTLAVDFECSGLIEILAFESLLVFYDVYTVAEKITVGIAGFALIMLLNALRITIICIAVHFLGQNAYYAFHTFIGRLIFYGFSVLLYFYVFTKPQVVKMRIGSFKYAGADKNS